jgi:hypothetical protein
LKAGRHVILLALLQPISRLQLRSTAANSTIATGSPAPIRWASAATAANRIGMPPLPSPPVCGLAQ